MALDSKKVETRTQEEKIRDFIKNHPNPNVKRNLQSIMQVAAEFDNNSKNTTTLSDVRKAIKLFTKGREIDGKSAGGLAGRLASRGYGKARR
jgi:hypothetical protein